MYGEYIRTKRGHIGKIERIAGKRIYHFNVIFNDGNEICAVREKDIKKHSLNIIDLIEEGDYVNGEEAGYVDYNRRVVYCSDYNLRETEIREVVTKQQFDSIKYVLGGKEE